MQSARMVTLPFILFELFPFELCASQKLCPLYNLKTIQAIFTKLYTNINQHEMTCRVQEWLLCLMYFLSYFPWNFVPHKNRVRSITWKPLKLYSRNFIQVSTSMSWCAECKNSNSVIYTLSLGHLSITKTISYDYFIPGYDCAIVNYIDRSLN